MVRIRRPLVRWDDLSILLAVHREGSLAAASKVQGVDASTVSRRLRALEEALDARLVDRTPDGLVLTDLARQLLPHAEQAEAAAQAVHALAAGAETTVTGAVRVALADAFADFLVAPAIGELLDAHPGLTVELVASPDLVDLSRLEAEVAVRFVRPTSGDLVAQRVASTGAYRGWIHPRYVARYGALSGLPEHWIGWGPRHAHLPEAQLYARLVNRPPRLAADSLTTMLHAWEQGVGALLMPSGVAQALPDAMVTPEPSAVSLNLDVWVVTHASLRTVPRVRVVRDWLVARIRALTTAAPQPVHTGR